MLNQAGFSACRVVRKPIPTEHMTVNSLEFVRDHVHCTPCSHAVEINFWSVDGRTMLVRRGQR